MPFPFSRGVFIASDAIYVPKGAGDEEMEEARAGLEKALNSITAEADAYFDG